MQDFGALINVVEGKRQDSVSFRPAWICAALMCAPHRRTVAQPQTLL